MGRGGGGVAVRAAPEALDAVTCRFGVMDFADVPRALREMRRVLRWRAGGLPGRHRRRVGGALNAAHPAPWTTHAGTSGVGVIDV